MRALRLYKGADLLDLEEDLLSMRQTALRKIFPFFRKYFFYNFTVPVKASSALPVSQTFPSA